MRATAAGLACLALGSVMAACGDDGGEAMAAVTHAERTAGSWKTWVLKSGSEIQVPAPAAADSAKAKADEKAVKDAADRRSSATQEVVGKWSGPLPTKPWTDVMFRAIEKSAKNPPLSTRNQALIHVAMSDAVVSAYHWKYQYNVKAPDGVDTLVPASPDPSYPSEHAAIAGAASKVIAFLYPGEAALRLDEMADEAAQSRVDAGTNTPSDVEAGLALGRAVADKVIAYAKTDGAGTPWNGRRPAGIGTGAAFWNPPPGSTSPPTDPEAAKWKPWVLARNDQFRPPPPPAYNSAGVQGRGPAPHRREEEPHRGAEADRQVLGGGGRIGAAGRHHPRRGHGRHREGHGRRRRGHPLDHPPGGAGAGHDQRHPGRRRHLGLGRQVHLLVPAAHQRHPRLRRRPHLEALRAHARCSRPTRRAAPATPAGPRAS